MRVRNTAIALGIGAATAAGLSLLKVNKDLVIGSTAVVVGAGLMIALKEKNNTSIHQWKIGDRVLHETLGKGEVKNIFREGDNVIVIQFDDQKRLSFLDLNIAPLIPIKDPNSKVDQKIFIENETEKNISSISSTQRPIKRDAIQNVLETELENFNLTIKTYATWKALKRLAWVMEDDDTDEDEFYEFYEFIIDRYEAVSSPEKFVEWMKDILYSNGYDNENPDWLESEWSIGPNLDFHAFNSKEKFLEAFNSDLAFDVLSKSWKIACSNDLYNSGKYEEWQKKEDWFYKNKIWEVVADRRTQFYFKKQILEKYLTFNQLKKLDIFDVGQNILCLELSRAIEAGTDSEWMDKNDLLRFYELPLELLEHLENPSDIDKQEQDS